MSKYDKGTFGYDYNYLASKDSIITLKDSKEKSLVIVSSKYQGKVFTSSFNGMEGPSLGFINYDAIEAKVLDKHFNAYGGENRFWIGPEGGKYSIFIEKGKEQVIENWYTPSELDTEEWKVDKSTTTEVRLSKKMKVTNYLGNTLHVDTKRIVSLLENDEVINQFGIQELNAPCVAYKTENIVSNADDFKWTKETGTICIWMLDMFPPSENAFTLVPFEKGSELDEKGSEVENSELVKKTSEFELSKIGTFDYFGKIPSNRLFEISTHDPNTGLLVFKTDGKYRSKLGLTTLRSKGVVANYDFDRKKLTVVTFDQNSEKPYLNQLWNPSLNPLVGDVLNAYNDGPLPNGEVLGAKPFFELESSSPAALLDPGENMKHTHIVYHFYGEAKELNPIVEKILGITLEQLQEVI